MILRIRVGPLGGGGQDYMWTGTGVDVIAYTGVATAGYDVVYDFQDGADHIGLAAGLTYAGLQAAGRIGFDAVNTNTFIFDTGTTGSGIILLNFNIANLSAADFVPFV